MIKNSIVYFSIIKKIRVMKNKKKLIELLNKVVEIAYLDKNLDYEFFDFEHFGQTIENYITEIEESDE